MHHAAATDRFQDLLKRSAPILRPIVDRIDEILASGILALVVVGSFWRLRFGVDFSDEAFYAAITQRYALGDVPYIDEYNLRQTASLLPVPFYWLYMKIMGAEGTVYFLRILYFLVQGATAVTVYQLALPRLPRSLALIAATLPLVFIPFLIPTCSYNNLGAMLYAAGMCMTLRALLDDPRPRAFMYAGLVHGLACVAYPPIALPVMLVAVAIPFARTAHWDVLAASPTPSPPAAKEEAAEETDDVAKEENDDANKESKKDQKEDDEEPPIATRSLAFREYMLGLIGVGLFLFVLCLPGLLRHGVSAAYAYETMTSPLRTMEKAKEVLTSVQALAPQGPGALTMLGVLGLIAKYESARKYVLGGLAAYLGYYFQDTQPGYTQVLNSVYLGVYVGLAAGFYLIFIDWKRSGRTLLFVGWLPAVAGGYITAFATANPGCMNGGVGLFAGAVLTMIVAPMGMGVASMSAVGRTVSVLAMAVIPLGTLSVNLQTSYRSGPLASHTDVVSFGPYKGIHSAPDRVRAAEDMTRELREVLQPKERMLSYYDFPAAYLVAPVRPAMPTVWTDRRAQLHVLLPYYQKHRTGRGIVFYYTGAGQGFSPQLEALVDNPGRLLKDGGWFRIYREPPP